MRDSTHTDARSTGRRRIGLALRGFVGGSLAIGLLGLLGQGIHQTLLIAPFGATCVLLFAVPDSPLAQPRNVVCGHLLCASVGLGVLWLAGSGLAQTALAVGAAIALMQLTATVHPPAGANPVIILLAGKASWHFLVTPILAGTLILLLLAHALDRVIAGRRQRARN